MFWLAPEPDGLEQSEFLRDRSMERSPKQRALSYTEMMNHGVQRLDAEHATPPLSSPAAPLNDDGSELVSRDDQGLPPAALPTDP